MCRRDLKMPLYVLKMVSVDFCGDFYIFLCMIVIRIVRHSYTYLVLQETIRKYLKIDTREYIIIRY